MSPESNHLIDRLPPAVRASLLRQCERVPLPLGEVLCMPQEPTRHVYFPVAGFVSLVAQIEAHPGLEVGMVGREGLLGAELMLGVPVAPLRALVQGEGAAWRIDAAAFTAELAANPPLRQHLHQYLYVLMAQLAVSSACLRFHLIGPRLARWLLMSQDRAHADRFHVTHEFLAYMLGVRRVGITAAAGALQQGGLIEYHRGELHVIDRQGLEAAACSCYAANQTVYASVLGAAPRD